MAKLVWHQLANTPIVNCLTNIPWHYHKSPDIINCHVSMFSTGTFRYAIDHLITLLSTSIKICICYSSKKIMRHQALWVGSLMYGIMFTLGHSCVRKSHQLFSCEFAKLAGMVLWGRISWCSWQSHCIFPAVIWEMQAVLKGVSFYPVDQLSFSWHRTLMG